MSRRVFIAGGAHTPFTGKGHPDFIWKRHPDFETKKNPTYKQLLASAVDETIATTGLDPKQVDKLFLSNFIGELFVSQGHMGSALVGVNDDFAGKPSTRVEAACASGGVAVVAAQDALLAGADIVLVAGVEVQTTASARTGGDYLARAADYERQRSIDEFTFPALFGKRTKAYREKFGVTEEQIGRVAVKAYSNANRNPFAHMRTRKMTLDVAGSANEKNPCFLANEEYHPYIKLSDCSQVSDGASAMLLVSEAGLVKLGLSESDVVELVSTGHAVSSLFTDGDLTSLPTTKSAVEQAYKGANISAADLGVAEVHDCFTVTELMMYEAMGLAEAGKGADLVENGDTDIGGRIPVNTGGGLVGFGHPVGATGIKQPLEIFRQMKGLCGDYQIPNKPLWGMTVNMGGDDKTVVAMAIKNLT